MLVLDLDPSSAQHLVRAIDAHRVWCRANGIRLPDSLDRLALLARNGQGRTEPVEPDELAQDGGMPLMFDYDDAARLLSVSPRTVRRLVASGELPAVTLTPGTRRILRSDLEAYAQSLATASPRGA